MILQALDRYYDRLVEDGKLERVGWQPVRVSYALQLDSKGQLLRLLPLFSEEERGKKKVTVPRVMNVPAQIKRSVGIAPNFLCDNSSYILGVDDKGKPERTRKCWQASKELHLALLERVDDPAARAVVRFFTSWDPDRAAEHSALRENLADLYFGANLVFAYDDEDGLRFAHNSVGVQEAWDSYYGGQGEEVMRCLVTGKAGPIARLHPSIRGVVGGQAAGTSLVSFNAPAFESFGCDKGQGLNAPVSEKAAFAYSSALNYMIGERGKHLRLSDTTIVFWAESGSDVYAQFGSFMLGAQAPLEDKDLLEALKALSAGRKVAWEDTELDPDEHFYVLGLAPNAARLSVRFFLQDTFGAFARNLQAHHERLEIVRPAYDARPSLSFWQLLDETVNQKSRDKSPSPLLSGALIRAVLTGTPYPTLLLDQVELRIRAERQVTRGRAAILKAFLLRNTNITKEALQVTLNENTNYVPYLLGRLFAALEGLQQAANPGINTTIRDRFFNSACTTPAIVFPQLIRLAQAHLKKLGGGLAFDYSRRITDILSRIDQAYPTRLSLYDQGIFQLGYYHQTQARYTKKEEKNNV